MTSFTTQISVSIAKMLIIKAIGQATGDKYITVISCYKVIFIMYYKYIHIQEYNMGFSML